MASYNWADPFSAGNTDAGNSFSGSKNPALFAPEPVTGNSLTQKIRSLTNMGGAGAETMYNAGNKNLGQAVDYYSKILSGNRASIMEGLSPEIQSIVGQYKNAGRAGAQFGVRGGGRAQGLQNLQYAPLQAIQNLIAGVRPQAATAMTGIGENQLQLFQNLLSTALQGSLTKSGQDLTESGQNKQMATTLAKAFMTGQ
jgi:hypothetical protein